MESILRYMNKQAEAAKKGALTDGENQTIADYLLGKAELKNIEPIVAKIGKTFFPGNAKDEAVEIGREAFQNKELLPRLGRFLNISKQAHHISGHCLLLNYICKSGLSVEEIYETGGLGINTLLSDVINQIAYSSQIAHRTEFLSQENYAAFFADMYKKHPGEFEKLLEQKNDWINIAFSILYFYTHNDSATGEDFTQAASTVCAYIINMAKTQKGARADASADAAFAAIKSEPFFAENPHIESLHEGVKKDTNDWNNVAVEFKDAAIQLFYYACALSPSRLPLLDAAKYISMYINSGLAFQCISRTQKFLGQDSKKDFLKDFFDYCLPFFEEGSCPKNSFLSHFARSYSSYPNADRTERFYKLLLKNEEHALAAADTTDVFGGTYIMYAFWEKGLHKDKAAIFEKKLVDALEVNNAAVRDYFLGKGDTAAVQGLPKINLETRVKSTPAAYLSQASSMPQRIVTYAIFHNQGIWLQYMILDIKKLCGEKAAQDFLNTVPAPVEQKISILIDGAVEEYREEAKQWFQSEAARLTSHNTALLEAAFKETSAKGKALILEIVYGENPNYNPQWLLECLGDTSKVVRDLAVGYLSPHKHLKDKVEELAQSKKKAVRECAEKLLMVYGAESSAGGTAGGESGTGGEFNALAYCTKNIPAGAAKTLAWAAFESLPKVRLAGTDTPADDIIVLGYIYLLVSQKEMSLPPAAIKIRACLDKSDLGKLGESLYHVWKQNGAPAKTKGVLVLAAIDCSDALVGILKSDIQTWADSSRGAIAADAVRAMALQGGNLALMTVDAIAKKFSNKQVQKAGEEAFQFAADQLGVDPEVLGDRIVPNLGFDSRGECEIDYGSRKFIAVINPSLQIDLKSTDGKPVKSLPAPGANDDAAKAAAAKADFAQMKKSLKSVVAIQCLRLELALSCNRTWTKSEWTALFVENPIMNMFATGLIWGSYDDAGNLIESFRYMEDGSFTNVSDDEVAISDNAAIGLCHPFDLGDELAASWTQQLSDYEIKQPVEQLARKVFRFSPDAKDPTAVTDFGGAVVYAVSLLGKLQKLGWRKGSVQDAGVYHCFYKEDKKQGIGAMLYFSGTYVGADTAEEVTVYDAIFYKAGTVGYGSYVYDDVKPEDRLKLSDVPSRLFSEICYDIDRATASRIKTDNDWEKGR
ncbi:MAG: DUF4132 domain-containing protein [Spirochaetes bacterium]|nr:DUF4132 domain-containing protein [Spirochaetota bacterium]